MGAAIACYARGYVICATRPSKSASAFLRAHAQAIVPWVNVFDISMIYIRCLRRPDGTSCCLVPRLATEIADGDKYCLAKIKLVRPQCCSLNDKWRWIKGPVQRLEPCSR